MFKCPQMWTFGPALSRINYYVIDDPKYDVIICRCLGRLKESDLPIQQTKKKKILIPLNQFMLSSTLFVYVCNSQACVRVCHRKPDPDP